MNKVHCPLHPDTQQSITHICLEEDCRSACLLCMQCLPQHQGHRTSSLDLFDMAVAGLTDNQPIHTSVRQILKIAEQAKGDCLKSIAELRQLVLSEFSNAEVAIEEQSDRVIAWANQILKDEGTVLKRFEISKETYEQAEEEVRIQREDYFRKKYEINKIMTQVNKAMFDAQNSLRVCRLMKLSIEKQIRTFVQTLSKRRIASSNPNQQKATLQWSSRQKKPNIQINGQTITLPREVYQLPPCCLSNLQMEDLSESEFKWSFRINKLRWSAWVGMCLPSSAAQNNFLGITKEAAKRLRHGFYILNNSGKTISHSDSVVNCQEQQFQFREGDVIRFIYDPRKGVLTMAKAKSLFKMNIETKKGQVYSPCAFLSSANDQISLFK